MTGLSLSDTLDLSLSDRSGGEGNQREAGAGAAGRVPHCLRPVLGTGVAGTSGDDIAEAAGLSTRTIWRYFRSKESCVEPLLAKSADRFLASARRWPHDLSLSEHLAADSIAFPLSPQDIEDELSAVRLATMTADEPALRSAYLMVHDQMELGLIPVIADRLGLPEDDLTVRLCAAAVTGAFRVVDEDVSKAPSSTARRSARRRRWRSWTGRSGKPPTADWVVPSNPENPISSRAGACRPGEQACPRKVSHGATRTHQCRRLLQPARARRCDDLPGRHQDRLPRTMEEPAQRLGAGRRRRRDRAVCDGRRHAQCVHLPLDARFPMAALHAGQRR